MQKYYILNEIQQYKALKDIQAGQTIVFDMPPFCSGDYSAKVEQDEAGLYIYKRDAWFTGCRDLYVIDREKEGQAMTKKEVIESVKRWFQLYMGFDTPEKMLKDFTETTGIKTK